MDGTSALPVRWRNDMPSRRCFGIVHLPFVVALHMSSAMELLSLAVLSVTHEDDLPDITFDRKFVNAVSVTV